MTRLTIQNEYLTVEIDTLGAELASIRDAAGIEYLWQGDARFWKSRAPVLFPIVGGLKNDQYKIGAETYTMAKHGFARKQEFVPTQESKTCARFLLVSKPEFMQGYPFDFTLLLVYRLTGNQIQIDYQVTNPAREILYCSVGAHDGYACPEGIESYHLEFEQVETLRSTVLDGNLLTSETIPVVEADYRLPLHPRWFEIDALVFASLRSRAVTLVHESGKRRIRVDFPGFTSLGIWTKVGAPYLCIEPWCGLPDYTDSDSSLAHKRGILSVAPCQTLVRSHKITIN
ncbi:MAG: aldose 1-epimerase family protein [Clostridiaceae bacterium]|nr:aldose 1-epimerase family protein [Clostridiaceae bacterium]